MCMLDGVPKMFDKQEISMQKTQSLISISMNTVMCFYVLCCSISDNTIHTVLWVYGKAENGSEIEQKQEQKCTKHWCNVFFTDS